MKHILIISFLTALLSAPLYAQNERADARLEAFVKNIQTFNHLYQQEKAYLHFDNTGYFLGENIWFKAYVTTASYLTATPMSRVLYVELLDLEGNVLSTQKLLIKNGQADGAIPLTRAGLKSGFYEVRAYTRLMLNWDTETLFSRVFPVFEKPDSQGDFDKKSIRLRTSSFKIPIKRAEAPSTKKLNVDFFPEGGQLINGTTSVLAFKVTDKEGQPQEAVGCICNAQGDTVSVFSTVHEGMGSFIYTPDGGKNKIWIRSVDEKKGTNFTPPAAELSGCAMQVQNLHPEQVRILISATPEYSSSPLGFTVMCRGKLAFFKVLQAVSEKGYSLIIPKSELPTGINQLTLFTSEGKILSERLVYVSGEKASALRMEVRQNKNEYRPYEQVDMEVSVHDAANIPVETTLSFAVRDQRTEIPSVYEENIYSNLLLSSDLKGYISNPGYYFESNDKTHLLALDLLMLTQGFRRYSWQQMAGTVPFQAKHKIEKGIVVDGTIKSIVLKKTKENIDVKMTMFSDSSFQQAYCPTDSIGTFNYLAADFYGKQNLQIESKKKDKRKEFWITLDRLFSPQGRAYSYYDTYIPSIKVSKDKNSFVLHTQSDFDYESFMNDSLSVQSGVKVLKELIVKGSKTRSDFITRGINIMYDVVEEENKLEDRAGGYNEEINYFLERINPFFHDGRYKGRTVIFQYQFSSAGSAFSPQSEPGTALMESLTGTEESSSSEIETKEDPHKYELNDIITSSDVESIAIIEDRATCIALRPDLASQPRPFVLVVLRLNLARAKRREPIGVRMTSLQGYSMPRQFYSPNYAEYQLPNEQDFRRTLYWEPNVKTGVNGKATVRFFNNSTCKGMSISAETMTPDGQFGSFRNEK